MLTKLKGPLTAAMVSSLALVPATTVAYMATADIAVAKSDKAGGGGKGGGQKSAKSKSGTKGKSAAKGKSGTKSASAKGGKSRAHTGLDKFIGKLTGKKTVTKTKRASGGAKVAGASKKSLEYGMHPSELGKMNGALNANVNALIAHVKNGNTNGPIGGMAALAVAGYAATGADETVELADKFATLDQMLIDNDYVDAEGNPDLQAYLDALESTPGNGENSVIRDALDGIGDLTLEQALLAENNGEQDFESLADYEAWRDGTTGADPIDGAGDLITELEGQDRPDDELVDYYRERIEDRTAAEDYMLSIWNKGDGDDTMRSEQEERLLTTLYDRIEADGDALTGAIEEHADLPEPPAPDAGDEVVECAADDAECGVDEELAAAE